MAADIRPARASDVEALSAIEKAVFETDLISSRSFRRLIGSGSAAVIVAADRGTTTGYSVVLFRAGSRTARLYSIAAAPGHAGLGRLLLAAAEDAAARRGAASLRLEVRDDNARAIALYEKNAYRCIGRVDGYYEDGMAARRYEKPLGLRASPAARLTAQPGTAWS